MKFLVIHITHEGEMLAFISVNGKKQYALLYQHLKPAFQLIDAGK